MTQGQTYNGNCPVYVGLDTAGTTLGLSTLSSNNDTYISGCLDTSLCTSSTTVCTEEYAPVCGCDNHTYSNLCFAHKNAINISTPGVCSVTNTTNLYPPSLTLPDLPVHTPVNLPIPVQLPIPIKLPILPVSPILPVGSGGKGKGIGGGTGTRTGVGSQQPTAHPTPGFRPVGDPSTLAPPYVIPPPPPTMSGTTLTTTLTPTQKTLNPHSIPTLPLLIIFVTETEQPTASPALNTNTTNTTDTAPVPMHHQSNPSTSTQPLLLVSSATRTWHRLSFAQLFSKDVKWVYDVTKYHPRTRLVRQTRQRDQSSHEKNNDKKQDKDNGKGEDKGQSKSKDEDEGQSKKKASSSYHQRGFKALRWCFIEVFSWTILSNYTQIMMFISQSHHFS